jgi:DNA-binding response OmpR family regulator
VSEDERLFLVVDPDARAHRALESALTDCGGRVMVRESADQALEALCSEPVELVIASTTLADGDGFRLCSMMRGEADFDAIPLIFISDDSSKSRRLEGFQAGAADYLSEPFFFAELQMRIEALLGRNVRLDSDVTWTVDEGSLADRSLVDILTEVEQNNQTGTLSVARDGRQAVVHFEGGKITGAVSGTLEDKEALLGLVAWPAGEFVLRTVDGADAGSPDPDEVVLVGMRPLEAWNEVVDGLPELRRVLERDAELVPEVAGFDGEDVAGVYDLFDDDRTLGEVISESSPDLVVTLRIVDHLVDDGWLGEANPEAEVSGPGIGEPKPDLARWIDPAGWSAAVVDGTSEQFRIVPPREASSDSAADSETEPDESAGGADERSSDGELRDDGDRQDDIETSAQKLERIAEASDVEVEGDDDADESSNSDDSDESEAEQLASGFDSEPDEEEISSVLKTDSEPELTTDSQPMVDSESADGDEPESADDKSSSDTEASDTDGEQEEATFDADSSDGATSASDGEAEETVSEDGETPVQEDGETPVQEDDPQETLDLDSVPEPEDVQPTGSEQEEAEALAAEAPADSESPPDESGDEDGTDGASAPTPDIDPVTLLDEADPGRDESDRDEEQDRAGPQLHDRHDPGTIERVELSLDRRGHGATQTDYAERDEEPPSARVEPKVPDSETEQVSEQPAEADGQDELETIEIEEEVEGEDRLGPNEETPVTGLDAASPEEGAEYTARDTDSSGDEARTAGEEAAPEEISTDELPRATRGTVGGGDSGSSAESSSLLIPGLVLVVLVGAVGYMVSDDLSSSDGGGTETANAETGASGGDSPVEDDESSESGSADEEGAKPTDETETMAQGAAAGMEEGDPGGPSLQIVEETRRQGRDIAGGVSETASGLPTGELAAAGKTGSETTDDNGAAGEGSSETAGDDAAESKPEESSDESEGSTDTTPEKDGSEPSDDEPGEVATAETSGEEQETDPDESASDEETSGVAETSNESDDSAGDDRPDEDSESTESSDTQNIDAIAGLIDRQKYTTAEQKLETLPAGLQEDAKVRDLYLDLAAGYQTEAGDVAAAKRVYQEYLELFPDGKYASDVRSILSRLEGE